MIESVLFWNVRGIGNKATVRSLAQHIKEHKIYLVAISEPRIKISRASQVARRIDLTSVIGNNGEFSKIWLFHSPELCIEVVESHLQYLTVAYKENSSIIMFLTIVYASCNADGRRVLFDSLMGFSQNVNVPWLIGGDFNCVVTPEEKMGGNLSLSSSMTDFQGFISAVGLTDVGFIGPKFTWTNNQIGASNIRARLDRVLVNPLWIQSSNNLIVRHLSRGPSDHSPLLVQMNMLGKNTTPGRFIYQQMWHMHAGFFDFVKEQWHRGTHCEAHPFYILQKKLSDLKTALKIWNKEIFGDVIQAKIEASSQIERAQAVFDEHPTLENKDKLQKANAHMRSILAREEVFWYQKSRIQWLSCGDKNTQFFHHYTKVKRQKSYVHRLMMNDAWVENQELLFSGAVEYFKNLLTSEDHDTESLLLDMVPQLIMEEHNQRLCELPTADEIKTAVFNLSGNSAPGPDGFSGSFFTFCWEIVENDIIRAIQGFFQGWGLPRGVTSSIL